MQFEATTRSKTVERASCKQKLCRVSWPQARLIHRLLYDYLISVVLRQGGAPLPFFSLVANSLCAGVNIFAQSLTLSRDLFRNP